MIETPTGAVFTLYIEGLTWVLPVPFEIKAMDHYHTYRVTIKNTFDTPLKLIVTLMHYSLLHQGSRYVCKTSKVLHNRYTLLVAVV